MSNTENRIPIASAAFLALIGVFFVGFIVGNYQVWPYEQIAGMRHAVASMVKYGGIYPDDLLVERPAYAANARVHISDQNAVTTGFRAIMGHDLDAGNYVVWLIDEKGQEKHVWQIDYNAVDPDGPSEGSDQPHGLAVLADGSIIVNFDHGDVMARFDQCGRTIWKKTGAFHHSLDRDDDGSFWTWEGKNTAYGHYHYLVNFDALTGKTIRSIGLVESFIEHQANGLLAFSIPQGFEFQAFDRKPDSSHDIFHPNDLEVLTSDLADAFPDFSVGDLLISMRTLHMVAVLDPQTLQIKWSRRGPWRYQHDPDFRSDGTISVFDNNTARGRSSIIAINPSTDMFERLYESGNARFYSPYMGKQQGMPNNHNLITSPDEGRVIEIDESGNVVFEFNNVHSNRYNVHLENAIWIPPDFFDAQPTCSAHSQ